MNPLFAAMGLEKCFYQTRLIVPSLGAIDDDRFHDLALQATARSSAPVPWAVWEHAKAIKLASFSPLKHRRHCWCLALLAAEATASRPSSIYRLRTRYTIETPASRTSIYSVVAPPLVGWLIHSCFQQDANLQRAAAPHFFLSVSSLPAARVFSAQLHTHPSSHTSRASR